MYKYFAYNNLIISELLLPLNPIIDENYYSKNILYIKKNTISFIYKETSLIGTISYSIKDQEIYINVPNVAQYLYNNNEIIVDPYDQSDIKLIGLYLIHFVMLFIINNNNYLLLHGSAVTSPFNKEEAMILIGKKGAGKSTLAATLSKHNSKILCDDLIPISKDGLVHPGIPIIKLFEDSYKAITNNAEISNENSDGQGKYHLNANYSSSAKKLNTIIILSKCNINDIEIKELTGGEKIKAIIQHIIKIDTLNKDSFIFTYLMELTKNIKVYSLKRVDEYINPELIIKEIFKIYKKGD